MSAGGASPRVRRARAEEAEALSDLAFGAKASWGYDEAFMAACRAELTITARQVAERPTFVAEDAGAIAGFYSLEIAGAVADVSLFFVDPARMRAGVGRVLWQHMKAEAERLGVQTLTIGSDPNAVEFYARMGARRDGLAAPSPSTGRRLPRLVLTLSGG